MNKLNYHHLFYFWQVARNGNLTRTAEQLHVAQSALSSQIRQLEHSMGTELFRRVVLPASLPQIITSLRIALGVAWLVIVAAEMVGMDSGLGYLINDARNMGKRYDLVAATMILIGLIGIVLDYLVRKLETFDEVRWGYVNR